MISYRVNLVFIAFICLPAMIIGREGVDGKSFQNPPSPVSQVRGQRNTYGPSVDAKQNIYERLREIESVPDLTEFLAAASPCLQPVLAEMWQTMQRDAYEKRRRTRYSRAIKRGQSISRGQSVR